MGRQWAGAKIGSSLKAAMKGDFTAPPILLAVADGCRVGSANLLTPMQTATWQLPES
jgi:hypothetical protein